RRRVGRGRECGVGGALRAGAALELSKGGRGARRSIPRTGGGRGRRGGRPWPPAAGAGGGRDGRRPAGTQAQAPSGATRPETVHATPRGGWRDSGRRRTRSC